jgi:aryl-alcohol dehydrogenase-like predicted oxidoreductase
MRVSDSLRRCKRKTLRSIVTVAKIDAVQAEYSAFETLHETDGVIDTSKELGIAYVAYSPLGYGWFVDYFDYNSPDEFAPDDFRRTAPKLQGDNFYANKAIVEEVKKLAKRKGCTTAQVALAWVAAQGMIPIPDTIKLGRMEEDWASREVVLSQEEMGEMRRIVEEARPKGERYGKENQAMVGH